MIQANCRARFTAEDFQFIVRTLGRSPNDQVSLVDLLSDAETRDAVLDHPRLVEAILSHAGHLSISSSFYFYVLARHASILCSRHPCARRGEHHQLRCANAGHAIGDTGYTPFAPPVGTP